MTPDSLPDRLALDAALAIAHDVPVIDAVAAAIRQAVAEVEACSDSPCNACVACLRQAVDIVPEWHERKLREARSAALDEAAQAVRAESVDESTGEQSDLAYNQAVRDCAAAVAALKA